MATHGDLSRELAPLADEFPGWNFGTLWPSMTSGTDVRTVYAQRGGTLLADLTVEALRRKLVEEESPNTGCICGHPDAAHEHYRQGSDCGLCNCEEWTPR